MTSTSGLLVLDKPTGITSHDVVARVRRILGTRKVGHAGTLDPMATGVLIVGVNKATRLLGHLALRDKQYTAVARLGATTVSDDSDGDVTTVAPPDLIAAVSDADCRSAAASFVGVIDQRPSAVSAVKVDGRRAYERVRAGEDVQLATRRVEVTRLDVTAIERHTTGIDLHLEVECSTGTYVRALARDIGALLGIGGHVTSLRRTRVGPFDHPIALEAIEREPEARMLTMSEVAVAAFDHVRLDETAAASARVGARVPWPADWPDAGVTALLDASGQLLALARNDEGVTRYVAVLA